MLMISMPEVTALFDYYDAVAEEKGLHLTLAGDANVNADRLMLRRAIGNVLSNAIRHSAPNTTISIQISADSELAVIQIENTVDLIPPDFLERIFDRFFRVDTARQRSDGTGLGLAITKSIITAHGGSIFATSSGTATTFTIKLPLASVALGSNSTADVADFPRSARAIAFEKMHRHSGRPSCNLWRY
jgi:two-component system heavy metal sensor histidine kinase CusS